jgi:predicted TIM-barrel fold metal-dependent hydrolase
MDLIGDDLTPGDAVTWCRAQNDMVAQDLMSRPTFSALAALPIADGQAAAAEFERAVKSLGLVGAAIPTQVNGVDLERPASILFRSSDSAECPHLHSSVQGDGRPPHDCPLSVEHTRQHF